MNKAETILTAILTEFEGKKKSLFDDINRYLAFNQVYPDATDKCKWAIRELSLTEKDIEIAEYFLSEIMTSPDKEPKTNLDGITQDETEGNTEGLPK